VAIEKQPPCAVWFGQKVKGKDAMKFFPGTNAQGTQLLDFGQLRSNKLRVEIGTGTISVPHWRGWPCRPGKDIAMLDDRGDQSIGFEFGPFWPACAKATMKGYNGRVSRRSYHQNIV
jgi:hypothetical protein